MLPTEVESIILDYAYGLEHVLRFRPVLCQLYVHGFIHRPYWIRHVSYFLIFE